MSPREHEHHDREHHAPHEAHEQDIAHSPAVHGLDARVEHDALGPEHTGARAERCARAPGKWLRLGRACE